MRSRSSAITPLKNTMNEALTYLKSFTAGHYEVRFCRTEAELNSAQRLRYKILYQENSGCPSKQMKCEQRDADEWDAIAYHVIVVDLSTPEQKVIGTLRLVSNLSLQEGQCFYTEKAFNLEQLRDRYQKILELSRFCIDSSARSGSTLMMIWKFTMQFIIDRQYQLMLGCASFLGTDVEKHKAILSYLYQHNLAPQQLMPTPTVDNHIKIASIFQQDADWENAKKSVPTLLRGYLKIGAKISDAAIIDRIFNTLFVCIYVDAKAMVEEHHRLVYQRDD